MSRLGLAGMFISRDRIETPFIELSFLPVDRPVRKNRIFPEWFR